MGGCASRGETWSMNLSTGPGAELPRAILLLGA